MLLNHIRKIPLLPLGVVAILLSLAPFSPEPHLVEKLRMLSLGELTQLLDIFDLFMHGTPLILFLLRLTLLKPTPNEP